MNYKVKLTDGTVGTIDSSTLNYQHADDFIGEIVNVSLYDENGNLIFKSGKLEEVFN